MLRFIVYLLLAGFVAVLVVASYWIGQQAYSWMPPQATAEAQRVDDLFSFLTSIGAFIFLGLVGMMVYSVLFYRASPEDFSEGHPARSSTKLEILWLVAPTLLVLWIAAQNINIYNQLNILGLKQVVQLPLETAPADAAAINDNPKPAAEQIEVIAKQWVWSFRYPNNVTSHELHLPVNQRTQLDLQAEDVIHGFYVPAFRLKQDIVPRRKIDLVVTPIRVGKYRLRDSQFSGTDFASMEADVYVESPEAYSRWLAEAASQPMLTANSTVDQLISKTWFKSGWYTSVPSQSAVANHLSKKERDS